MSVKLANGWFLRARQEEVHDAMIKSFAAGNKEFLLAANCRFGKTITTLQTLLDYAGSEDMVAVVISTMSVKGEWAGAANNVGLSTELLDQEINDIDFDHAPETGKSIIYCSTQKLGNGSDESINLIKWYNRHTGKKFLVYDECHLGSGTDRTVREILDKLDFDHKVYLSGTPFKKHLKKEFGMDTLEGKDKIYLYTIQDEREDYKAGNIKDYIPVQLEMHVLSYAKDIESVVSEEDKTAQQYGVSSAYFKKIFSKPEYKSYAEEFLNNILDFAKKKNIKNFLFFVPLRVVGNDLVKNFAKAFKDKIEFKNLCGDYEDNRPDNYDEERLTTDAELLNAFYAENNGKLKVGITCNKCGTGTTLRHLDAVAFLKDTTDAISFIQKSQRVRTPEPGKTVGYCLCFNTWQGLKAFCDYAKASSKTGEKKEDKAVEEAIDNGAVKLILNLEEVKDYADIIDVLETYKPGQYPLFDDFDFDTWSDSFVFMQSLEDLKKNLAKKYPYLRKDPDFEEAETAKDIANTLDKAGLHEEADNVRKSNLPTEKEMQKLLEDNFVCMVTLLYRASKTISQAMDYDSYESFIWETIKIMFGTEDVWKYILETYPRYISMIYKYLDKNPDKIND